MEHWHYVGHFNPRDPVDRSQRPYKPKVVRPIPGEALERTFESLGRDIEEFVSYHSEGYVLWSAAPFKLSGHIQRFAHALAEAEGAIIMTEMYVVEYPPEAKHAQEAVWRTTRA